MSVFMSVSGFPLCALIHECVSVLFVCIHECVNTHCVPVFMSVSVFLCVPVFMSVSVSPLCACVHECVSVPFVCMCS